jgi:G3E family GTPase
VALHLDDSEECAQQIAFADVLVLNKTDLVTEAEAARVEERIRAMNAMARVIRTVNAQAPLGEVLDVGGFDLARALERKPSFLEPEYPFEWASTFALGEGEHALALTDGPDPSMDILVREAEVGDEGFARGAEIALRAFSGEPAEVTPGDEIAPGAICRRLALQARGPKRFTLRVPRPGRYTLYTQHLPPEFALQLLDPRGHAVEPAESRAFAAGHSHDDTVGSVGIHLEGAVDSEKLNAWLSKLLRDKGNDLFRMKGILHLAGQEKRHVFQGVHMLLDAREDRPWGLAPRVSDLVFIGRNLDRAALTEGFVRCLA